MASIAEDATFKSQHYGCYSKPKALNSLTIIMNIYSSFIFADKTLEKSFFVDNYNIIIVQVFRKSCTNQFRTEN